MYPYLVGPRYFLNIPNKSSWDATSETSGRIQLTITELYYRCRLAIQWGFETTTCLFVRHASLQILIHMRPTSINLLFHLSTYSTTLL